MKGYHFVGETLLDGRPVPADGDWLEHEGPLVLCESGLHWSAHPLDAVRYAPNGCVSLCLIEADGETILTSDKSVSRRRMIVSRVPAAPLLREYARWCATQVLHLWAAPQVVRDYLATGAETLREAAGSAAWNAAEAAWNAAEAAGSAAWNAADAARSAADAARSAAWSAADVAWNAADAAWSAADVAWNAADAARSAADAAWSAADVAWSARDRFAEIVELALAAAER